VPWSQYILYTSGAGFAVDIVAVKKPSIPKNPAIKWPFEVAVSVRGGNTPPA